MKSLKFIRSLPMPMSNDFKKRLLPALADIVAHFGTPFHIYDEAGIIDTGLSLKNAFSDIAGFMEYYAVKALPNPSVMAILQKLGFGFDCSSIPELVLSRQLGAIGEKIIFTSNNTTGEDFKVAFSDGGCILNLDDITLIPKLPDIPDLICFRYNPGPRRTGNTIIGNPVEAKYGVSQDQILEAYRQMVKLGSTRFGLHTMLASNELNYSYIVETTRMLLELIEWIAEETAL